MRSSQRAALAVCALLAFAIPARVSAQFPFAEKQIPGNVGASGDFKFITGNQATGFGVQLGPYTAQMTSYPGSPLITIYCVDFLHDVYYGEQWTANISRLTPLDIGDTRLGIAGDDADALRRYKKAAWLAAQFATNQNLTSWQQIHAAIWTVALAGDDHNQPYYQQYGSWIDQMSTAENGHYNGFDFSEWAVLTDVRADDRGYDIAPSLEPGTQEFLVHMTVTPEPETVVMMFTGVLLLGLALWRRGGLA